MLSLFGDEIHNEEGISISLTSYHIGMSNINYVFMTSSMCLQGVSVLMPPQLLSKFESNYVNFKLDEKNSNKTIRVAVSN